MECSLQHTCRPSRCCKGAIVSKPSPLSASHVCAGISSTCTYPDTASHFRFSRIQSITGSLCEQAERPLPKATSCLIPWRDNYAHRRCIDSTLYSVSQSATSSTLALDRRVDLFWGPMGEMDRNHRYTCTEQIASKEIKNFDSKK